MAKRDRVVFDLVEDDHEIGAGGGTRPPARAGVPLRGLGPAFLSGVLTVRGRVARHRVASGVAVGVAAAVVLGLAVLETVGERERIELLRDAPGGVTSLAGPPVEEWRYEPDGSIGLVRSVWGGPPTGAAELGGNLVLLAGERTTDGDDPDGAVPSWSDAYLVAVDVQSGSEAWRVPLGTDPDCTVLHDGGAVASGEMPAPERITCLSGDPGARSAVVVDADGAVSAPRPLRARDAESYGDPVAAPDGLVVRARFEGVEPQVDCSFEDDGGWGCTTRRVDPDRAAVVRAEDATTGEEVWRETVSWSGYRDGCVVMPDGLDPGDGEPVVDPNALEVRAFGDRGVTVSGCGVSRTIWSDGTTEDAAWSFASDGWTYGPTGASEWEMIVRSPAGDDLFTTTDYPVLVKASDGRTREIVLLSGPSGVRGHHLDGTPAWPDGHEDHAMIPGTVPARVGDVVLVDGDGGGVLALDLPTGTKRWEWGQDGSDASSATAFTDGDTVLLVLVEGAGDATGPLTGEVGSDGPHGPAELVALDVRSGTVRWQAEHDDATWLSIDGRLVSVTDDGALVGHASR
ncbi:hypothetical protein GCM10028784_35180 [Myceligenerans cantabricum]